MTGGILDQGWNLMAFGMGAVFVFLTLLVIVTSIMSAILGKCFPASHYGQESAAASQKQQADQQTVTAIMAAIKHHRSHRNN